MLWEFWFNRFQSRMVTKDSINPKNSYYASTLTTAQNKALPEEVDRKNHLVAEQTLISNLILWLVKKQQIGESLQQFYSVLSRLAARCNFGELETRISRDVFIVNLNNREAQNELCRSTKTPGEVYCIAFSYERGYKYAKTYGSTTGGTTTSGTTGGAGAFQTKTEPEQQAARPWIVQETSGSEMFSI